MSKFSTVINFVASYLNAKIPFLLLMFCIIGSRNTILNLPVHVFIWPWKWYENYKLTFLYKGLSLAGGNEFMENLCADFEKCIYVIDELIHASPLTWQFCPVNWSVKTCPEVLKIGWLINGVTLACIWGHLFKFWTFAFLIWKTGIIHTS